MKPNEFAFAEAAAKGRAEADPDPGPGPDGHGSAVEPPGTQGHDHPGNRPEPGSGGIRRRRRQELTPEEVQALLEAERDPADPSGRPGDPGDRQRGCPADRRRRRAGTGAGRTGRRNCRGGSRARRSAEPSRPPPIRSTKSTSGRSSTTIWIPAIKSPASETVEKPSFETFLSRPVTLADHLRSQLSVLVLSDDLRDAADLIIGNLDENGYLDGLAWRSWRPKASIESEDLEAALKVVQSLDPAGVGARDVRECLLLQLESRERARRAGLADRRRSPEAGRAPPVQGTGAHCWAGLSSTSRSPTT